MLRSILVPLDGSPFSASALPVAAALAARHGATLHLVAAYTPIVVPLPFPGAPTYDTRFDEEQRAALRTALQGYAGRLLAEGGVAATSAVIDGDPAEVLAGEAGRRGVDLIVMTTHGRGGFDRAWLGSVADELLRRSPVPLLLSRPRGVQGGEDADGGILGPVVDPAAVPVRPAAGAARLRRVLVPLDGSPLAEEILAPVLRLGAPGETTVVLLHVVPVPQTALPAEETYWTPGEEDAHRAARAGAAAYLERAAAPVRAAGYAVETAIVLDHDPARVILREAATRDAGMIAISTHARGGLARLRLGSVADKVVRAAGCPTLVARPRGA
jgi:nucleotide-binding universal stress UspA family protein